MRPRRRLDDLGLTASFGADEGDHKGARKRLSLCSFVSPTHRLLSSSVLGLPHGFLNVNHKKELLRNLYG